jgi:hypothetical protein
MADNTPLPPAVAGPQPPPDRSKRWIVALIVLAMVGTAGIAVSTNLARERGREQQVQAALEPLEIVVKGTSHRFMVEVMRTPETRARGLMFRQFLPADRGMLFDFEREEPVSMWMRNTYIPLDMLFIRADGVVHRVHERAQPLDETSIPSGGPVRYVLEVNAGVVPRLGITAGDSVAHALIRR